MAFVVLRIDFLSKMFFDHAFYLSNRERQIILENKSRYLYGRQAQRSFNVL